MQIQDKVGIVTGAASGIGRATALELVDQGAKGLALVDLSETGLVELAQQINQSAGRELALAFAGDVTDAKFRAMTPPIIMAWSRSWSQRQEFSGTGLP